MAAPDTLYQEIQDLLDAYCPRQLLLSSLQRSALLVLGMMASRSCLVSRIAKEVVNLQITFASKESVERRLRRSLNDRLLRPEVVYQPLLDHLIDWHEALRQGVWLVLAVDDTTQEDRVHMFRVSLTYRGRAVPLAWALWPQNRLLHPGQYWQQVDQVLDKVKAMLPPAFNVVVSADRAFDIPEFVDRISARGWHWVVRHKAKGSTRFLDRRGREYPLRQLVMSKLPRAGTQWKCRGRIFKKAGWRWASVVGVWAAGEKEALVVITDLPTRWEVLQVYSRRYWIEPAFRDDKSSGWQWEASQVRDLDHCQVLLVAMALATLLSLCLGWQQAQNMLVRYRERPRRLAHGKVAPMGKPRPAKESLFGLGLDRFRALLYGAAGQLGELRLHGLDAPSWSKTWYGMQSHQFVFCLPVRP
jgi:hypothetical protein